jgi:hypothetical protein
VVVIWSKTRAVRRVVKQLPVEMFQQCWSASSINIYTKWLKTKYLIPGIICVWGAFHWGSEKNSKKYLIAMNLNTHVKRYYCCVIFLY